MQDELQQIDTAPIDALLELRTRRQELQGLLDKAEAARDKVSAAVFERVQRDYRTRLDALEQEARPLREKARAERMRLQPLHARVQHELTEARLVVEELEFRRELGELEQQAFEAQGGAARDTLARAEHQFQAAEALRQRLIDVVPEDAADEPPAAVADEPEPETEPRRPIPDLSAPPVPAAPAEAPQPVPAAPPRDEETVFIPAPAVPEERVDEGSTLMMKFASLVAEDDAGGEQYQLGARTTIGRNTDNVICIQTPKASRHHAVISLGPNGYVISDLKSGNGTFVNDEKIKEQRLADGDRIRIGDRRFVFRSQQ
jgi:pSer/pThr/pTyr-binding forkhead associated (FHA) protein